MLYGDQLALTTLENGLEDDKVFPISLQIEGNQVINASNRHFLSPHYLILSWQDCWPTLKKTPLHPSTSEWGLLMNRTKEPWG